MPRLVPGGRNAFLLQTPRPSQNTCWACVSFISRWSTVRRRSWHLSARRIALRVFLLKWLEGFEKLKDASSSQVNSNMLRNATFRRWLFQFCKHASPIGESLELCKWMSSLPTSSHTMRATEDLGALFPLICKSLCWLLWCFSDASAGYGIISNLPSKVFLSGRIAHRLLEILGSGISRMAADAGW